MGKEARKAALAACALAGSAEAFVMTGFSPVTAARGRMGALRALRMSGTMSNNKVVVTGLGAVTPIGTGADQFFANLLNGESGLGPLPAWADDFPCKTGGTIKEFTAGDWYANKKEAKRQSRYMHLGVAASKLGMQDAALESDSISDKGRFGVLIGSALGGSEYYEEASNKWGKHSEYAAIGAGAEWGDETFAGRNGIYKGPRFCEDSKFSFAGFKVISPFIVPSFIMNSGSGVAAVELDAQGPNYCIGGYGGEGAGGAISIGQAYRFLSTGVADVMIAGGSESCLTECVVAGFNKLGDMQNNEQDHLNLAFDKKSKGYALGEGAGVLVLETEQHAKARGAKIYCELAGFGVAHGLDSKYVEGGMPTTESLASAITSALRDSGVDKTQVGYVSAHGAGIPQYDSIEAEAIQHAFGDHSKSLKLSAIKNQLGNSLAAAGALEAAVCAKALHDGVVPGTQKLTDPVVSGLDFCASGQTTIDCDAAISVNMAMGGTSTCLVFKKYSP